MNQELTERLKESAKTMKEWEEMPTSIAGLFIVKMPGDETSLGLKILPVDEEGKPMKRKGVFITSLEQWEALESIFTNEKGKELVSCVDSIKGSRKGQQPSVTSDKVMKL